MTDPQIYPIRTRFHGLCLRCGELGEFVEEWPRGQVWLRHQRRDLVPCPVITLEDRRAIATDVLLERTADAAERGSEQ